MKFSIVTILSSLLFILTSATIFASEWPSKSINHPSDPESMQRALHASAGTRSTFFSTIWNSANSGSPVDNRAYLFALAIDLYNSIPPDLQPDPQELAPDEDVYEPNLWPIKKQLYFNKISTIDGNRPRRERTLEEKMRLLERFKRMNNPADVELIAYFEKKYLRQYIREQVSLGKLQLDAQDAPASISPCEQNIYQPKYYAELKEYVETIQPLIDSFTPPWEAEQQVLIAKKKDKPATTVVEQPKDKKIETKSDVSDVDARPKEDTNFTHYFLIITLLVISIIVVVYILHRRGKK